MSSQESRITGRVKWFNNQAGYGFISTSGGKDAFVHHSAIKTGTDQFRYLVEGEYCEFEIVTSEKETASNVTGPNGGKLMCETRNERRALFLSSQSPEKGKGKGTGKGKEGLRVKREVTTTCNDEE